MPLDEEITQALDMAISHMLFARFGRITPRTRAAIYRTAARILERAVELLRESADEQQRMGATARMVRRAYGGE